MSRSAAAPRPATVPLSSVSQSRIERAACELDTIRRQEAALKVKKEALSVRLLAMVKQDGTPDAEGRVRYQTDAHKFVVIPGKNVYTSKPKMVTACAAEGLTPKQIAKVVAACVTETPYEYVGVYTLAAVAEGEAQAS